MCKLVDAAEWWAERATRWNNFWDADEDKPDRRVSPVHLCSEPPPLGELEDAPLCESCDRPRPPSATPKFVEAFGAVYNTAAGRHLRCSTYCQRKDENGRVYCRFHFPKEFHELNEAPYFYAELCKTGVRWRLYLPGNDPLGLTINRLQFASQWANCDFSPIVDHVTSVEYVTKYASKPEVKSKVFAEIFREAERRVIEDKGRDEAESAVGIFQSYMVQQCGGRDWSAQEVSHVNMGLRTVWSSHDVHHVSIPTFQKMKKVALRKDITAEDEDNAPASGYNAYEKYLRRLEWAIIGRETTIGTMQGRLQFNQRQHPDEAYMTELLGMNVMQFYGKYTFASAGAGAKGLRCVRRRTRPCVVVVKPHMPRSFGKKGDPRQSDYCRVQLLKHKAFNHAFLGDSSVPTAKDEIACFLAKHGGDWVQAYAAFA